MIAQAKRDGEPTREDLLALLAERDRELAEARRRETATADVLKVISRSAFDLQDVLDTLVGSAISLCEATRGVIWLRRDGKLRLAAHVNYPDEWVKATSELAIAPAANAATASGLAAFTGEVVNVEDMLVDPRFVGLATHQLGDYRGVLAVPMDRDGAVVGVIALSRPEARRFTDRQVALVRAFADQAVIAIENVRLFDEVKTKTDDLAEALERQTATADILRVISQSRTDAQPVFDAIVVTATRRHHCDFAFMILRDGAQFSTVAGASREGLFPPERLAPTSPVDPTANFPSRAMVEKKPLHVPDWSIAEIPRHDRDVGERFGSKSTLYLPLLRGEECIGAFVLAGKQANVFGQNEIALAESFCDQAVIAIENARLFEEREARTRDLSEALQRQTATADVLKVISRSAFDLDAVLTTLVQSAQRLCGARGGMIFVRDGDLYRIAAHVGMPAAFVGFRLANPLRADRISAVGRVALTGEMVHLADALADPDIQAAGPRLGDFRAVLSVPLVRDDEVVGIFALNRPEPGLFAPGQVKLVQAFADQAAIAIANVRLFDEVKTKTDDLAEALQQQTATAEVLKVISRSAFDLQAVLDTLVSSAAELSGADFGIMYIQKGDAFEVKAVANPEAQPDYVAGVRARSQSPGRTTIAARVLLTGEAQYIPDISLDSDYDPELKAVAKRRAVLGVPLKRGDSVIGAIGLAHKEVGAFSARHIELARTFADQAVIAIENARLFEEVQAKTRDLEASLERQTAMARILEVISGSPTDAKPVFDAISLTAVRLFRCGMAGVFRVSGETLIPVTAASPERVFREDELSPALPIDPAANFPSRAVVGKATVRCDYTAPGAPEHELHIRDRYGMRSAVFLPLLRARECIGVFLLMADRNDAFSDADVALAESFRDQALIAVENARLFNETQEALAQQTATADVLKVISRSVFDLDRVLETLIDTAVRLARGSRGTIFLRKDDVLVARAFHRNVPDAIRAYLTTTTWRLDGDSQMAQAVREGRVVHVPDLSRSELLSDRLTRARAAFGAGLWTPLMRDGQAIGVFGVPRDEPIAFSDREIELVQTFADQAVIAIENSRLFEEVQAKTRDLSEALVYQTASASILQVIASSPTDVAPVLRAIVDSAREVCGAYDAAVNLREGDFVRFSAHRGPIPLGIEGRPLGRGWVGGRAILDRAPVHVRDLQLAGDEFPEGREMALRMGHRAILAVPLLREGESVGAIVVRRNEAHPFTDKQIEVLRSFADQAVIAIGNARLFEEVQARTRDLSEALQQQTATADVLKAISRTAFDLDTVLETLISTAVRLCNATYGQIFRRHGDVYRYAASRMDVDPAYRRPEESAEIKPGRGTLVGRVALANRAVSVPDAWNDAEYEEKDAARLGNVRAMLGVPLTREGEPIGAFALARSAPVPFTGRQIELVTTFADQAVIAIENVRLFDEVQARTRDLSEALQQQTATAEVLQVISRSAFGLKTVLQTLVDSAVRLCASDGVIYLRHGDEFRAEAAFGADVAGRDPRNRSPRRAGRESVTGRVALSGRVEQIPDNRADPDFQVAAPQRMDMRALLGVPLLRDGEVEGVFVLGKPEPGLFGDRAVELVRTFADQAVIAIQNVRLFEAVQAKTRDLEESLRQQTATAEVLKVISRSAFDLQKVLDTLIGSAVTLGGADSGLIYLPRDAAFYVQAHYNAASEPAFVEKLRREPQRPGRASVGARVLLTGEIQHVPDNRLDADYDPLLRAATVSRAVLGVPLKRDGVIVGAIALARREPGLFTDRQIELAQTFADQAVIAIENARLLDEVQSRTRELEQSLDDLRKAQDRLVQSEKLASLGQLTAGIAHEIKNPLNFVNNFSALSRELLDELREVLDHAPLDAGQRDEAEDILGMVGSNLDKVVHHGKRADSIVKNMLLHSREGSGERASVNVNAMVEEALNLAYHGARAEKPGLDVTIAKSLDPNAGAADIYPQEMTRVLLNLISNAFYATAKRRQAEADGAWAPTVAASTRDLGDRVEIAIRDNGTGIPEEVKAKMFNPFFTTKPAGEGTGLGLSLSHDIVVKQHGGTIGVETEPGAFTRFTIVLPRGARTS